MRVYLSPQSPPDKSYMHISNVAMLDSQVETNEASEIIVDKFLSQFSYDDIKSVVGKIISKMRLNSSVIFIEPDMNLLSQKYVRDDISLVDINNLMFGNRATKSVLTMQSLNDAIGGQLNISEKHFDENNAQIVLKAGRN